MRSQLGSAAEPLTDAIADAMIASLFEPASSPRPGRVGLELEFFAITTGPSPAPVSAQRSRAALAADPDLFRQGRVTFEPGGQLELSPDPQPSVTAALEHAWRLAGRASRALAAHGIALEPVGMHPWASADEIGLQVDAPRYRVMQRHFDAIGPAGRRMMRQTAALQVCLDLAHGREGIERWRLANLAGPALAAAFANSAGFEGRPSPAMLRTRTWQAVDPSRTGFDGFQVAGDPVRGYRDFCLAAAAMPLRRDGDDGGDRLPFRLPWQAWRAGSGSRPDVEDLRHHLTTLFPPVRPRGHLEIRYLDALPRDLCTIAVSVLAAVLYDPEARRAALELLAASPTALAEHWRASSADGLGDRQLRAQAAELLGIAVSALGRFPQGYFPAETASLIEGFRQDNVLAGRCPAGAWVGPRQPAREETAAWS